MNNFQRLNDILDEDYQDKPERIVEALRKDKETKALIAQQLKDAYDSIIKLNFNSDNFTIHNTNSDGVITLNYKIETHTTMEYIPITFSIMETSSSTTITTTSDTITFDEAQPL